MEAKSKLAQVGSGLRELLEDAPRAGKRRILLVDRDPERRKERISMLKRSGYLVYPALVMDQALSRCRPGTFDLIIVNATEDADSALEFRDQVRKTDPHQRMLLMSEANLGASGDEVVSSNPQRLLERVETILKEKSPQLANRWAA